MIVSKPRILPTCTYFIDSCRAHKALNVRRPRKCGMKPLQHCREPLLRRGYYIEETITDSTIVVMIAGDSRYSTARATVIYVDKSNNGNTLLKRHKGFYN